MVTAIRLIRLVSPKLILTLLVPVGPIAQMRVIAMVQVIIRPSLRRRRRRHRCGIHASPSRRVGSTGLRAIASNLESRIEREEEKEPVQEISGLLAVDVAGVTARRHGCA